MTIAPPATTPAVPYHRLGRTGRHRWWHPILATGLVAGAAVAAGMGLYVASAAVGELLGRPVDADGLPTFGDEIDLALLLAGLALQIPIVLLAARLVQGRPAGTVSSVAGRLRWRWLGRCLLVAVPAVVLMIVISDLLIRRTGADVEPIVSGPWVDWRRFAAGMAVVLLLVPLQAAGEEYMCRGWLLQAVGSFTRSPWPAIVVQAVVFALLHGVGTAWGMADLFFVAVVSGWLTVRTGGLEVAIALHVVNNVAAFGLAAAGGYLVSDETSADLPWQVAVAEMLVVSAYAADIVRRARAGGHVPVPARR